MPDKTLTIASFKYGLDSRRQDLASQPGTLVRCVNGHINPGGEVEKRKAFISDPNKFPTNTFGIQDTASGIMCFGSDPTPSGLMPAGTVYQQLISPTGSAMTQVVGSCNYQGKAFVIAKYADGVTALFYDGKIINESWVGTVFTGQESYANQASFLASAIAALPGWLANANVSSSGSAQNGSVIVKSPGGITFQPTDTLHSASADNAFASQNLNDPPTVLAGTTEVRAVAAFQVIAGASGTFELTAPGNPDGSGVAHLSGIVDTSGLSTANTATALVTAINNNTIETGYTAIADTSGGVGNGDIFVFAPIGWGALANGFVLTIAVTGVVSWQPSAQANLTPSLSITPSPLVKTQQTFQDTVFTAQATAHVKGGVPPYTFTWSELSTSHSGITIQNASNPVVTLSRTLGQKVSAQGTFQCHVVDSLSAFADAFLSVFFQAF